MKKIFIAGAGGERAHQKCHQFLTAASCGFEVLLDAGKTKRLSELNSPYIVLHIPSGIKASEVNFSSGSVCSVLAPIVMKQEII